MRWWLPPVLPVVVLALLTRALQLFLRQLLHGSFVDLSDLAPWVWVVTGTCAASFWLADGLLVRRRKTTRGGLGLAAVFATAGIAVVWGLFAALVAVGQGPLKSAHAWGAKDAVEGAALWIPSLVAGPGALAAGVFCLKVRWGVRHQRDAIPPA